MFFHFGREPHRDPTPFSPGDRPPRPPIPGPGTPCRDPSVVRKWIINSFPFWRVATSRPHPFLPRRLTPRDPPVPGHWHPLVGTLVVTGINIYIFPHSEGCPHTGHTPFHSRLRHSCRVFDRQSRRQPARYVPHVPCSCFPWRESLYTPYM